VQQDTYNGTLHTGDLSAPAIITFSQDTASITHSGNTFRVWLKDVQIHEVRINEFELSHPAQSLRFSFSSNFFIKTAVRYHLKVIRVSPEKKTPPWKTILLITGLIPALFLGSQVLSLLVASWLTKKVTLKKESEFFSDFPELAINDPVCGDERTTAILKNFRNRILPDPGHRSIIKIALVKNNMQNAYAAPGGQVVILSGLLTALRHQDELAGILAHEISHVLKRHSFKAMVKAQTMGILSMFLGFRSGEHLNQIASLKFSRFQEIEADQMGARLLLRLGLNPVRLADGLISITKGRWQSSAEMLSTHPSLQNRLGRLTSISNLVKERRPGFIWKEKAINDANWEHLKKACTLSDKEKKNQKQRKPSLKTRH